MGRLKDSEQWLLSPVAVGMEQREQMCLWEAQWNLVTDRTGMCEEYRRRNAPSPLQKSSPVRSRPPLLQTQILPTPRSKAAFSHPGAIRPPPPPHRTPFLWALQCLLPACS